MGFFSDLKEDLSQAVNELMPEEAATAEDESGEQETVQTEAQEAVQTEAQEAATADGEQDLAAMLEKLEQEGIPEKAVDAEDISESASENVEETVTDQTSVEELFARELNLEMEDVQQKSGTSINNITSERAMSMMEEEVYSDNGEATDEKSIITEGMTINGDISSQGSIELLGTIVGNIDLKGKLDVSGSIQGNSRAAEIFAESAKIVGEVNSRGSVKIGQSSVIIGNISATSAVIAGAVKGDIDVKGPVILDTSAIVMGNIKSKSVQINNGAVVEGLCSQCYADVNPSAFFDEFKKSAKA